MVCTQTANQQTCIELEIQLTVVVIVGSTPNFSSLLDGWYIYRARDVRCYMQLAAALSW